MQSPLSEQTGNLASNTGGASRRSSSNARRPLSSDEININLVMRMGFSRRAVELAIRTLSESLKNSVSIKIDLFDNIHS